MFMCFNNIGRTASKYSLKDGSWDKITFDTSPDGGVTSYNVYANNIYYTGFGAISTIKMNNSK